MDTLINDRAHCFSAHTGISTKKTVPCVILHIQTCGAGHSAFLSVCASLVVAANTWKASEMGQTLGS